MTQADTTTHMRLSQATLAKVWQVAGLLQAAHGRQYTLAEAVEWMSAMALMRLKSEARETDSPREEK